jgi:hypothetical protein
MLVLAAVIGMLSSSPRGESSTRHFHNQNRGGRHRPRTRSRVRKQPAANTRGELVNGREENLRDSRSHGCGCPGVG